ncbi:MAG: hypothetical protein WC979_07255 [Candidatus Pacearchaeota archaeon]|jgi:hypothetical protein
MGRDLTLLPLRISSLEDIRLLQDVDFDRLNCDRDSYIFSQIARPNGNPIETHQGTNVMVKTYSLPLTTSVVAYHHEGKLEGRTCPSGEEYIYTTAKEMQQIKLPKDISPRNVAIFAYICRLDKATPILIELR